jgi:aryl carrier-like protein
MAEPLSLAGIRADVAELLYQSPDEVNDGTNLFESGLDSVRIISLVERWRQVGVEISFMELAERPTLAEWWELLSSRLASSDHV